MNLFPDGSSPASGWMKRQLIPLAVVISAAVLPFLVSGDSIAARITSIVGVCICLWLLEVVPPFVPTLLLWVLIPVVLSGSDSNYSLSKTLRWAADPVLALFFGGFALGAATERQGLDKKLAAWAFASSRGSFTLILLTTIGLTAFMSMWISNIAAAALMFACLRPSLSQLETDGAMRRTLLVGVALGANLGGIATPIGTGPNAIAMSYIAGVHHITFVEWMTFALPLTVLLLGLGYLLLRWRARRSGEVNWEASAKLLFEDSSQSKETRLSAGQKGLVVVLILAVILWLTEPFHGVSAAVVALAAAAALFLFRLLKKEDIGRIDWSTLLLIAGGITAGRLLESSKLILSTTEQLSLGELHPTVALFLLCFTSALLSALMSNTATAVLLIPIATAFLPQPSTAILIAIAASFGMPFVISTPPNAMAHGEGGVRSSDLLFPGLVIMFLGCALVSLTGRAVLNLAGIP